MKKTMVANICNGCIGWNTATVARLEAMGYGPPNSSVVGHSPYQVRRLETVTAVTRPISRPPQMNFSGRIATPQASALTCVVLSRYSV